MTLTTLNSFIAGVIFFAAVGSIKSMDKSTCNAVRLAVLSILVGCLGQALGQWLGQWGTYLDTLLYGGVLALLVANKRSGEWIPTCLSPVLSIGVLMLTVTIIAASFCLKA